MLQLNVTKQQLFKKLHANVYITMLYVYTPNQEFNTIRISVLGDITKIWKKSSIFEKSKTSSILQIQKIIIITATWIISGPILFYSKRIYWFFRIHINISNFYLWERRLPCETFFPGRFYYLFCSIIFKNNPNDLLHAAFNNNNHQP